ncbi:MAG: Ig-like domain-containing protein [Bacteroidales bacterium]
MQKYSLLLIFLLTSSCLDQLMAQRGYYDAPYTRYEADQAILSGGAVTTPKSYSQAEIQSEASDQVCVNMDSADATLAFEFLSPADGMVIRYCVPDSQSAVIGIYNGDVRIDSIILTSKWSWEYLWNNGDPNNEGVVNQNPKMRFDEVRYRLPEKLSQLKIVKEQGSLWIDFIEMEPVPEMIQAPEGAVVFSGDGSNLQAFIDANGGKTIYIPAGKYDLNGQLYFGVSGTKLQGAGMWYTQLHFTVTDASNGGLRANAKEIGYSDLYLTSDMTSRTNGYSAVLGVYTQGSVIKNIWAEHFAAGAWIAQYVGGGPAYADGFILSGCRFRNTYADGINLCKGTRNALVEHCNFRNNGDDGMAIWCADGLECINNTYRFNTVENGWRAAGAALYGGKDNKFYNLIIKDNLEIGITISNLFTGVGFNAAGMHDFHDITLIGCGTFNDCYNKNAGAINIVGAMSAGVKVQNIKLYSIDLSDTKCDAIRIYRNSGSGISNLVFENISVNGTGKEYPYNNADSSVAGRGYVVTFENKPFGSASYCSLNYTNLGGNVDTIAVNRAEIGNFKWNELTGCELIPVTGFSFSTTDTTLSGGATLQLAGTFVPSNATNRIIDYVSDNPAIALVNSAGMVTALAKGTATITATTFDGAFTASCIVHVINDPIIAYKIKNRWQLTYLYDAGDRARYGLTASNNSYLWTIRDSSGVVQFRNFSTGDYMNIDSLLGYVQCASADPASIYSRWLTEDAGSGFIRIQSAADTNYFIHIENLQNQAQYGTIEDVWWSAMWMLEPVMLVNSVAAGLKETIPFVYPNPSEGDFTLAIHGFIPGEKVLIQIFNMAGQVVFSTSCRVNGTGSQNLGISAKNILSRGNYLVRCKGNSTISHTRLVINN